MALCTVFHTGILYRSPLTPLRRSPLPISCLEQRPCPSAHSAAIWAAYSARTTASPGRVILQTHFIVISHQHKCPSLSFTYNEPSTFAEYAIDIAQLAHKAGIKTVLVSNGYISQDAADELYPLIDAANIDMKGFSQDFYSQMCQATLQPVLDSLEKLYALSVHLEITTLIIPGKNDDDASTIAWLDWIEAHLDKSVPLHFNAYYPAYKCSIPCTQPETLYHIRSLAQKRGFINIHMGNI